MVFKIIFKKNSRLIWYTFSIHLKYIACLQDSIKLSQHTLHHVYVLRLLTTTETEDKMKSGFFLNVVVGEGTTIL